MVRTIYIFLAAVAAVFHCGAAVGRPDAPLGQNAQQAADSVFTDGKYDFVRLKEKYRVDFLPAPNNAPDTDYTTEAGYLMPPLVVLPGWDEAVRAAVNERRRALAQKAAGSGYYLYSLSFFDFYETMPINEEQVRDNAVMYYRVIEPALHDSVLGSPAFIPSLFFPGFFREASGKDVVAVKQTTARRPLVRHERETLMEYNAFAMVLAEETGAMLDNEKRAARKRFEYALLANDVYDPLPENPGAVRGTGWVPVTGPDQTDCPVLGRVFLDMQEMNRGWTNMGFHARIYRHGDDGEYVVAFSGTNLKTSAVGDIVTNVKQLTSTPRQYHNARDIALALKDTAEPVTIVGHSLGGGLATVAGLITGFDTYIYNPADLSEATLETIREHICDEPSIYAYATSADPVTSVQQKFVAGDGNGSSGSKKKSVLYPVDKTEIEYAPPGGSADAGPAGSSLPGIAKSIGKGLARLGDMLGAHSIQTIEDHFREQYSATVQQCDGIMSAIWDAVDGGTLFAYLPGS